jgi:cyanophycinase
VEDDDGGRSGDPGRLLIIGGAEDRGHGAPLLERFVELCGGEAARIVLVTTATGTPDEVQATEATGQPPPPASPGGLRLT